MKTKNGHANAVRATQSKNATGGNLTAFPTAKLAKTKAVGFTCWGSTLGVPKVGGLTGLRRAPSNPTAMVAT
eukprot:11201127-Lingulodinium_polyedra.AAC.1